MTQENNLVGRYVTAKLKGVEDCKQGVCILDTPSRLVVLGEGGANYECEPGRATVVPLKNLWGSTRRFALRQGVKE